MSGSHDCGNDVAAYVLGALDPGEVATFRRHLDTCSVCREEVVSMQQLADALPDSALAQRVPRRLRRQVMAEVRADARRTRGLQSAQRSRGYGLAWPRPALAFGTAFALAAAVVVGVQLGGSGSGATHVYRASVGDAAVHVTGGRGELIVDRLARPSGSNIYEVWLKAPKGKPEPTTALFSVTRAGRASVDVPGSLSSGDTVLVTEEPAGGTSSPTPGHTPVVVAQLS